jgi:hypothetical protein
VRSAYRVPVAKQAPDQIRPDEPCRSGDQDVALSHRDRQAQ